MVVVVDKLVHVDGNTLVSVVELRMVSVKVLVLSTTVVIVFISSDGNSAGLIPYNSEIVSPG